MAINTCMTTAVAGSRLVARDIYLDQLGIQHLGQQDCSTRLLFQYLRIKLLQKLYGSRFPSHILQLQGLTCRVKIFRSRASSDSSVVATTDLRLVDSKHHQVPCRNTCQLDRGWRWDFKWQGKDNMMFFCIFCFPWLIRQRKNRHQA